jgi:outer membrane protein TolC
VAVAAWYPDFTLSASYGFVGNMLNNLIQAPNALWSLGPSFSETVFDAGLRSAQIEAAHATYDETVANYRQTILTAFQQVEDNLVALHILEQQSVVEDQVVADARKTQELVLNQYKAGTVPYSSVLTAETTALSDEQIALTVRSNRFAASVALIGALGGGWDVSQLTVDHLPPDGNAPAPAPATSVADNADNGEKPAYQKESWTDRWFGWVDNIF